MSSPLGDLALEVELLRGALRQARRFLAEQRWRVHADGVTLQLRNGALLKRARQKEPLLHRVELLKRRDQRIRARRAGAPWPWQRFGDWRRATALRKAEARLRLASSKLLLDLAAARAEEAVAAVVTFEHEEGRPAG